jgi:DNA-binding MurR/RpiR family transcriptional regulator
MEGCVSNNEEAINYFDSLYFPVQDLVELDNNFQESMQALTVADDQIKDADDTIVDEEEYSRSIQQTEAAYQKLHDFVKEQNSALRDIPVYNNENALQRAALQLFSVYENVLDHEYRQMITLLKKETPADEDNAQFNKLLKESGEKLEHALQNFYDTAFAYGEQYNIDVEFDE